MRVLFTGGSGTISASSVALCAARGMDVYVINRGSTEAKRPFPDGTHVLRADVRSRTELEQALGDLTFDVVVDFLVFDPKHAAAAVEVFGSRTQHYFFISTASMYAKPPRSLPVDESAPRHNPALEYAMLKRDAEDVFLDARERLAFPVTIIRPSHTYDEARPPLPGHWTVVDRIARGLEIAVPGDGTSLWTLTHARDFAVGLVGLFGQPSAVGEAFNITSDDVYSWTEIYELVAGALGVPLRAVPLPSAFLPILAPECNWSALVDADLKYSATFDNSKIRRWVPEYDPGTRFRDAVQGIVDWRFRNPALAAPEPEVADYLQRFVDAHHAARRAVELQASASVAGGRS